MHILIQIKLVSMSMSTDGLDSDDRWPMFLTRSIQGYFQHKVKRLFFIFFVATCLHTYSDRKLSLPGAPKSVDGAVKQLVVMEADVTGIGANHHRVFFRQQIQITRAFLRQKWTRNSHHDQRGLVWTGTDNIQKDRSRFNQHTRRHILRRTHRKRAAAGPWCSCHTEEASTKTHPFWARLGLKAANIPASSLTWLESFLQTNPPTVTPAAAQNNILRAFTGSHHN